MLTNTDKDWLREMAEIETGWDEVHAVTDLEPLSFLPYRGPSVDLLCLLDALSIKAVTQ